MSLMTVEKEKAPPLTQTPTENAPAPETPAPSFRDVLRVVSFRHLWLGQAISQFGDALYFLVFVYMAEKLTGDPRVVGIVGVAQTLPFLLLSLPAGVVADRADRRRIMLASDLVSTGILLLFALLLYFQPHPHTGYLIAAASLLSVANVFFSPAKGAAIPQLVPPHLLSVANGLSLATQSVMPLAGLALSGTILTVLYAFSPAYFFLGAILINTLSFIISAAFIALLPPLPPKKESKSDAEHDVDAEPGDAAPSSSWDDLKSGLAYIKSRPELSAIVWLGMLVQGTVAPFMVVYVTVNSQWFGGAYWTLALCESCFFLGMVIGGAVTSRFVVRRPGMAFIIGTAIVGATIASMAFSRWYPLFVLWNFLAGLFVPYSQLPILNYIQRTTPNDFQGRVNSVLSLAAVGIQPLAIGLGGIALAAIGPVALLFTMGIGMAVAALGGLLSPAFRRAETPT